MSIRDLKLMFWKKMFLMQHKKALVKATITKKVDGFKYLSEHSIKFSVYVALGFFVTGLPSIDGPFDFVHHCLSSFLPLWLVLKPFKGLSMRKMECKEREREEANRWLVSLCMGLLLMSIFVGMCVFPIYMAIEHTSYFYLEVTTPWVTFE